MTAWSAKSGAARPAAGEGTGRFSHDGDHSDRLARREDNGTDRMLRYSDGCANSWNCTRIPKMSGIRRWPWKIARSVAPLRPAAWERLAERSCPAGSIRL